VSSITTEAREDVLEISPNPCGGAVNRLKDITNIII